MTNPKHTDTSRSGDLVAAMKDQIESWEFEDPRESWWKWQHQYAQAADLIETQAREIERLNTILSEMNDADVIARTMAENKRLREALADARSFIDGDSPDWRYAKQEQLAAIDAALAGGSHDQ